MSEAGLKVGAVVGTGVGRGSADPRAVGEGLAMLIGAEGDATIVMGAALT